MPARAARAVGELNGGDLNGVRDDVVDHQIEVSSVLGSGEIAVHDLAAKQPLEHPFGLGFERVLRRTHAHSLPQSRTR